MSIQRTLIIEELRIARDILDQGYDEIPSQLTDFDEEDLQESNTKQLEKVISNYGGMDRCCLESYVFESITEYQTEIIK